MMSRDPLIELALARLRQKELDRRAELLRLLREAHADEPGAVDRALLGLGLVLIRVGEWLRDHAKAESQREQVPTWW